MRCWYCGVEPDRLFEVTQINQAEPEYLPAWPGPGPADHEHAERPPSPYELVDAGHRALMRLRGEALSA